MCIQVNSRCDMNEMSVVLCVNARCGVDVVQ